MGSTYWTCLVIRVSSIGPDGTATLEDGRVMTLVVAPSGALGVRPQVREDHVAKLDQTAIPLHKHFDTSGLDQAG